MSRTAFTDFNKNLIQWGLEFFGLFYSSYPGIVVDNNDKDHRGRLLVNCPDVWGDNQNVKIWAIPRALYAGKKVGFHAMPQVGDNVWITFRNGKPEYPLWEYGWWTDKNAIELAAKDVYVFCTPKGHVWVIDEANNTMYFTYKNGKTIELTQTAINLGTKGGSAYKAVKGDTAKQALSDMCDQISALCDTISALTVTCAAPGTASSVPVNAAQALAAKAQVQVIKGNLQQILSTIVTLD